MIIDNDGKAMSVISISLSYVVIQSLLALVTSIVTVKAWISVAHTRRLVGKHGPSQRGPWPQELVELPMIA